MHGRLSIRAREPKLQQRPDCSGHAPGVREHCKPRRVVEGGQGSTHRERCKQASSTPKREKTPCLMKTPHAGIHPGGGEAHARGWDSGNPMRVARRSKPNHRTPQECGTQLPPEGAAGHIPPKRAKDIAVPHEQHTRRIAWCVQWGTAPR
jgi:hypothetical protein